MHTPETQLKVRKFLNKFITIPCIVVGILFLITAPTTAWAVLTVFNFLIMLLHFSDINRLELEIYGDEATEEKKRLQRVKDLYGDRDE